MLNSGVKGQDLLATNIFPEGVQQYNQSTDRSLVYRELVHFIHKYGIQTASPWMQSEILESMEIAMQNNYYSPLDDLAYEDFDEEYLALGLECYFGLWAHDPEGNGYSGDNEYAFNTRLLMAQGDTNLYNILKGFFGDSLIYVPTLPYQFNDLFSMSFDPQKVYSHKSQYLIDIKSSGFENISIHKFF